MSYTGAKAMQFKLAYIEAFNRMETVLKYQLPERDTLSSAQLKNIEHQIDKASLRLSNVGIGTSMGAKPTAISSQR